MKKLKRYTTDYLFSRPDLITSAGSVLNLAGNYFRYNTCDTPEHSDKMAIENDFNMIGQDLWDATDIAKKEKMQSQQ